MSKFFSKKRLPFIAFGALLIVGLIGFSQKVCAQKKKAKAATTHSQREDKSKRQSPPASVSQTIASGAKITINYGQPSLNGRTPGVDVEPKEDSVWRAGANEATVFETDKDVTINGNPLPAGKYSLFTLKHGDDWTVFFNKKWDIWGTKYDEIKDQNALEVHATPEEPIAPAQKLLYTISPEGKVSLAWGSELISFNVQ